MAIVCLDAGHGGNQPGSANGSRLEKNDTLRLTLAVRDILIQQGVKVVMTRESDTFVDVNDRANIANNAKADYFLSIHRNSVASSATGIEAWVYTKASSATIAKAKSVVDALCMVYGKNRGVKLGAPSYTDFAVNKYSNMPSALIEVGFLSNSDDNIAFDVNLNSNAIAISKSLCGILGVTYIKTEPVVKVPLKLEKGHLLKLQSKPLYASSSTKRVSKKITGTFYVYDGEKVNGRYRITNKLSNCGRKPTALFVTGWVEI